MPESRFVSALNEQIAYEFGASQLYTAIAVHYDAETREHMAGEKRQQLFDLITELVQWENSNNELVINAARAEIARCVASASSSSWRTTPW